MRTRSRSLVICALLIAALLSLRIGGVAAQAATPEVTAATDVLNVDLTTHTITSGPIFTPHEAVAFWFDVPGGGAGGFTSAGSTGTVYARSDGSLSVTVSADDWRQLPQSAIDIVAHGIQSGVEAVFPLPPTPGLDLTLHVNAGHTISAGPVFSPDEQVVFWYNLTDGSAAPFMPIEDNATYAQGDGTLTVTAPASTWNTLPAGVTSLVAHGLRSGVTIVYLFPAQ